MNLSLPDRAWPQHGAQIGLYTLCVLPFLVFWHAEPIPTFYNAWLACTCGLLVLLMLGATEGISVPQIALAPMLVLAALVLQFAFLPDGLQSRALLAGLLLLWATLLGCAAVTLRQRVGLMPLARGMALAVLLAALVNATSLILFHAGWRAGPSWLFLRPDLRANLAQVNHVADLLWLGVASVLFLWHTGRRGRGVWLWALPCLLLASALSGARAPLAYACWLVCMAWAMGERPPLRASLGVAVGYVLLLFLLHIFVGPTGGGQDSLSRLAESARYGSGGNIRLGLMAVAAGIAAEMPWQGGGWGSFAWESYQRVQPGMRWQGTAEHAHQLFFQLGAELGMLVPLLLLCLLLGWARAVWRQRRQAAVMWAAACGGIILLHAQVEYPLWYAHFLGLAVVLLALADDRIRRFPTLRLSWLPLTLVLLTGGYLLLSTGSEYRQLERWLLLEQMRAGRGSVAEDHFQLLAQLHQGSLLEPEAALVLAVVMAPTPALLAGKREVCARALRIEPQAPTVFTCALLDNLAGDTTLAEKRWRQALLVFRDEAPGYLQRLRDTLMPAELAAHAALLGIAEQSLAAD